MSPRKKVMAVTPILCVIIYLTLGFLIKTPNMWAWGLFVFLLIPIMPYLIGWRKIVVSVTFVITITYVLAGVITTLLKVDVFSTGHYGIWHPGWIIFLFIPVIRILMVPEKKKDEKKETKKEAYVEVDDNTYDAK